MQKGLWIFELGVGWAGWHIAQTCAVARVSRAFIRQSGRLLPHRLSPGDTCKIASASHSVAICIVVQINGLWSKQRGDLSPTWPFVESTCALPLRLCTWLVKEEGLLFKKHRREKKKWEMQQLASFFVCACWIKYNQFIFHLSVYFLSTSWCYWVKQGRSLVAEQFRFGFGRRLSAWPSWVKCFCLHHWCLLFSPFSFPPQSNCWPDGISL